MNFKIRCQGLFFGAAFLLVGCFWDNSSDYPPLKKTEVVGCWVEINPTGEGNCTEYCYSQTGKSYLKYIYKSHQSGEISFVEGLGNYLLTGGTGLKFNSIDKHSLNAEIDTSSFSANLTIIRDTLNDISPTGTLNPYARRDTTHNCGPHWMLFPKPADWELP